MMKSKKKGTPSCSFLEVPLVRGRKMNFVGFSNSFELNWVGHSRVLIPVSKLPKRL